MAEHSEEVSLFSSPDAKRAERARRIRERIAKEREQLLQNLRRDVVNDVRTRVAFILDRYPDTRDSDARLVAMYWAVFDHEEVGASQMISLEALPRVTQYTSIVRARQKIQNEYGLFLGDAAVARERRALANDERIKQRRGGHVPSFTFVFCDESGKSQPIRVVGSVWINGTSEEAHEMHAALRAWKQQTGIQKEFHFNDVAGHEVNTYLEFVRKALTLSGTIAFKAVALRNAESGGRSLDQIIYDMHYHLIVEGVRHDLNRSRAQLPRGVIIFKDKDDAADKLRLRDLRNRLETECRPLFDNQLQIAGCDAEASETNLLVQLADVFTGSVNRVLNRDCTKSLNHKDELAEAVLALLELPRGLGPSPLTRDMAYVLVL